MANTVLFTEKQDEEIKGRNASGEFIWALSKEYACSSEAICNAIRRAGGEPIKHKQQGGKPKASESTQKAIVGKYLDGMTIEQLSKEYGLGRKAISNCIVREGKELRPPGTGERKFSEKEISEMIEMYNNGRGVVSIAKTMKTSAPKVSKNLRLAGVEINEGRLNKKNIDWQPRRRVGPAGYVKIKIHPDDAFYYLTTDGDYILEHRYVMMVNLERALTKDESVHHINGDRQDNRIENLQLRKRYHGKGQKWQCGDCGSHNIVATKLDE